MDNRESFLDVLKETMSGLEVYGRITIKQLEEGIHIPLEWLSSKGIKKEHVMNALNTLCSKVNSEKTKSKRKKTIKEVVIIKRNNDLCIDICNKEDTILYSIVNFKKNGQPKNIVESDQFIKTIYEEKIKSSMERIQKKFELSEEEAKEVIEEVFNETQKTNDLNGLSASLCEMMQNIGKKYKEKNKIENHEIEPTLDTEKDNKETKKQKSSKEVTNTLPAVSRKGMIRRIIENFFFYDDEM